MSMTEYDCGAFLIYVLLQTIISCFTWVASGKTHANY